MAFIGRIGTVTEKFELSLTVHSVSLQLEVPCALKVIVKRGQHKFETQELKYNLSTGIVFFDKEIKFEATMYKRGQSYQDKSIEFRLVKVLGDKTFKDGKGELSLNGIAETGAPLFREDVSLKGSADKAAVVCVSLSLSRLAEGGESPIRSARHATTLPPTPAYDSDQSPLSVSHEKPSFSGSKTPMTAGVTLSAAWTPEERETDWSPVDHTDILTLSASPMERNRENESQYRVEAASPASPPLKSILSRPATKRDSPGIRKTVILAEPRKGKGEILKLRKVEDAGSEEEKVSSSESEEAPRPKTDSERNEAAEEEKRQKIQAEQTKTDRKKTLRLDLSRANKGEVAAPVVEFTKGGDTSSDEEPIVIAKEKLRQASGPITSLKAAAPNNQSKEVLLAAEEQRTGLPATRERSSACNGCVLQ